MKREPAPSPRFLDLANRPNDELESVMLRGQMPDPSALSGLEYRGLNTASWLRIAGTDRFVKGFAGDHGYNRRIQRGSSAGPWLPESGVEPEPFAFFGVAGVDPESPDNRYLRALLLDYSKYSRSAFDPAQRLRDYLVAVDGDDTLLLGHAFVAFGRARVKATFFVLERLRARP